MSHKNVYAGGTLCKNVYVGTQRVWTQATPLTYSPPSFATGNGERKTIYLYIDAWDVPTGLWQHPERIKEVRLSTGLLLPYASGSTINNQAIFVITLTDTLANLGVPLYTNVTIEIDYWPE